MSDEKKDEKKGSSMAGWGMASGAGATIAALITAIAGAGWPAIILFAALGLSIPLGLHFLINAINRAADKRDLQRAGGDAGETAVGLKKQTGTVSKDLDELQKNDPPKQA